MARHLTAALLRRVAELRIALTEGAGQAPEPEAEALPPFEALTFWSPRVDLSAAPSVEASARKTSPHDRITGADRREDFAAGAGEDVVRAKGGNDQVKAGAGADKVPGEGGDDRIWGGAGRDDLRGGDGDDRMRGAGGRDDLRGEAGDDQLLGGGVDRLEGGAGSDRLRAGGGADDLLLGGPGDDALFGGAGNDRLNPGDGPGRVFGGRGEDVRLLEGEQSDFEIVSFAEDGRAGFVVTRLSTGDEIRVFGVERAAYQGDPPRDLKVFFPVGAPQDVDPALNRLRETVAPGERTGVRIQAVDPDPGDQVSYAVLDPRFAIDAEGVLTVAEGAVFDAADEPLISVVIEAWSSDGSSRARAVEVEVVTETSDLIAGPPDDTGRSADDGVTRDPALSARVVGAIDALFVSVNGGAEVELTGALDAAGRAVFTPNGLADGAHQDAFTLISPGGEALQRTVAFAFALDRAAARIERFDLSLSSDTEAVGNRRTGFESVLLVGEAESGARLEAAGPRSIAALDGRFSLSGVANPQGENVFQLTATDLAGNVATAALTVTGTEETGPTPVRDWVRIGLERIAADGTDAAGAARLLTMLSTAMNDVAAAFDGTDALLVTGQAPKGGSLPAAVASAAHAVLTHCYPAFEPLLDQLLRDELSAFDGSAAVSGQIFGAEVAARVIRLREGDGRETGPFFDAAADRGDITLDAWTLTAADQFRPDGPPAPGSQDHAEALEEVEALGAINSAVRSADQTEAARYWTDGRGTFTTPGRWIDIAFDAAEARGLSVAKTAELTTKVAVSVADAMIAARDAALACGARSPAAALRNADDDGTPETVSVPEWERSCSIRPARNTSPSTRSSRTRRPRR